MALDAINPGMRLRVSAGERFPVDGTIMDGMSDVDRALVTGESDPQRVSSGSGVEAGTLKCTGSVDMLATRAARKSFLAEVTQMMAAAEKGRSSYVRIADRMARIYSPVVHILALTSFTGWMIWTGGDWHQSLTVAVAVLIITCPCALGLAVPVAHVVSASRLFANGILLKDGSALERLAAMDGAAFDKTGTLTTGEPAVVQSAIPEGQATAVAKALALRSVHPAARALARYLEGQPEPHVSELHEVPGHGVEGLVQGKRARLGRRSWVAELAPAGSPSSGAGVAFAMEGQPLWLSTLSERIRPGACEMIATLRARHIPLTLLSGDGQAQVASVAPRDLGITDYRAELKPGDKLAFLTSAAKSGRKMLMVGTASTISRPWRRPMFPWHRRPPRTSAAQQRISCSRMSRLAPSPSPTVSRWRRAAWSGRISPSPSSTTFWRYRWPWRGNSTRFWPPLPCHPHPSSL